MGAPRGESPPPRGGAGAGAWCGPLSPKSPLGWGTVPLDKAAEDDHMGCGGQAQAQGRPAKRPSVEQERNTVTSCFPAKATGTAQAF